MTALFNFLLRHARRIFLLLALACGGLLAFGLYLQIGLGLEPCPMCIVQRYALIAVALLALLLAAAWPLRAVRWIGLPLLLAAALLGAFTAARQSWLQWFPPEISACGRDLYGMIESFPLRRVIPMVFRGTGDCTQIDWTFLGLSIANWSFLALGGMALLSAALLAALFKRR